jgi:uncharacterized protein (DUF58 family)
VNLRLNAVLLAVLTALIAVLGDWSGSAVLASMWRVPAGLLLLGLAYESIVTRRAGLALAVEPESHWYLGRPNQVRMQFEQRLQRPLQVEFAPLAPAPFNLDFAVRTLSVPATSRAQVEMAVTPRALGHFRWPAQHVRVVGPLGLAAWSRQLEADCEVSVAPDLLREAPGVQGLGSVGNRVSVRHGAGAELLQLRPYQKGDPPRVIDWKASARARRLISRDFAEDQHLEVMVMIDAGRASGVRAGELDRFGHYVNAASRLAQHVVTQDDLIGLVVFAEQPLVALPPARGMRAITRLRKVLAEAAVAGHESNPLQAALRVRSVVRHRSLVVILTDLDDADVASQLLASVRMLLPKHLPFIAGLSSAAAESLAMSKADSWLDPYESLAAQEYCTGLQLKVQALRALGAPALVARPEQLESAVLGAYASFRQRRRV